MKPPSASPAFIATRLKRAATVPLTALAIMLSGVSQTAAAQVNPAVMPTSGPLTKQTMSRLLLTDAARSGNRIVAVGDRGYIVYSDSNGDTWERAKTPTGVALLTSVHFSDANTAWAVGHDSVILKSTDQGKEWTQSYAAPKDQRPLLDILFLDANTGFAVGAYGAFYETSDGGKTWASRKVIPPSPKAPAPKSVRGKAQDTGDDEGKGGDEDRHLNAIIKLASGKLLIVGEAGTLLTSADSGKTWTKLASPYKGSFFGAVESADGAVVIYGLRGNVFRAEANLGNWTTIATNTKASMMNGTRLGDGTIALAGLSGTLLVSKDAGRTFTALNTGTIKPLSAAVQGGPNSLTVVGETGARDVLLSAQAAAK